MSKWLIKQATIINEGKTFVGDLLIENQRIKKIDHSISDYAAKEIDASGLWLMPGVIDDQVHFREPGYTHKASIYSESKAGIAGGVTSFMEMPNTNPPALTQHLLQDKYNIAQKTSLANYSFYMGCGNNNIEEIKKTNPKNVCGVKLFMGSSTGQMVVDDDSMLEQIFKSTPTLLATHCENDVLIKQHAAALQLKYGNQIPFELHPVIRDEEACFSSSKKAVELARQFGTRLHILHISTAEEIKLFTNEIPLEKKQITAEVCVHHLWFTANDYQQLGPQIKCNPAIKNATHAPLLFTAMLDNHFDVIATDHAPHTWNEKYATDDKGMLDYFKSPSGLPLIQHSLNMMLMYVHQKKMSAEMMVEKMCHAPATCFQIEERGFIREGFFADIVLINPKKEWVVTKENIKYKCGWSPLLNEKFTGAVTHTFVNGNLVYQNGSFEESTNGMRLTFNR